MKSKTKEFKEKVRAYIAGAKNKKFRIFDSVPEFEDYVDELSNSLMCHIEGIIMKQRKDFYKELLERERVIHDALEQNKAEAEGAKSSIPNQEEEFKE